MSQQPNSQVSEEMDDSNDFFSLVFEDCHRRDTFPKVLKHPAIADVSALKRCSYSESDGAKVWGQCGVTMEDIKREIAGGRQKISSMTRSLCSPKKHVIFADDLGLELTSVKVFTKPQNETSQSYRHKVLWKATFCKPYLNFIQFLEKLNNQGVALENFSIEIDTEILSGSVKVRNFSFEKAVVVRVSDNDWQSYRDYPCTYRSDQHSTAYDTFTFEIPLGNPSEMMNRVEFCIRFKSASSEFWDNNNGANYQLVRESAKLIAEQQDSTVRKNLKTVDVPKVRSIRSNHINGSLTCGYIGFKPHFATNYTPTDKLICR